MFGWRRRSEGFEWREYVRTTILVRRADRQRRVEDARVAALEKVKHARDAGVEAGRAGAAFAGSQLSKFFSFIGSALLDLLVAIFYARHALVQVCNRRAVRCTRPRGRPDLRSRTRSGKCSARQSQSGTAECRGEAAYQVPTSDRRSNRTRPHLLRRTDPQKRGRRRSCKVHARGRTDHVGDFRQGDGDNRRSDARGRKACTSRWRRGAGAESALLSFERPSLGVRRRSSRWSQQDRSPQGRHLHAVWPG